jgi:hypothetical protein
MIRLTRLSVAVVLFLCVSISAYAGKREFYQIKVYRVKNQIQEQKIDDFLQQAYLPALHRAGIAKVGVFKPIATQTQQAGDEKLIYVFIPFKSYEQFSKLEARLDKDGTYQKTTAKSIWMHCIVNPRMKGLNLLCSMLSKKAQISICRS